ARESRSASCYNADIHILGLDQLSTKLAANNVLLVFIAITQDCRQSHAYHFQLARSSNDVVLSAYVLVRQVKVLQRVCQSVPGEQELYQVIRESSSLQ